MVTHDEYVRAINRPINITSRELRYAALHAALVRETGGSKYTTGSQESFVKLKACKLGDLIFWRWLCANEIGPSQTTFRSAYNDNDQNNAFIVNNRRISICTDLKDWHDIRSSPASKCELSLPASRITNTAPMADYYVYCLIDGTYTRAAMIGYYECYALSSPDKKRPTCHQHVNVPITRLHPMSDLTLILKVASESDGKIVRQKYISC
jgi:hypothetical protein